MDLFDKTESPHLPFVISEDIDSSCQWDTEINAFCVSIPGGELVFSEMFFNKKVSDRSVEYCLENDLFDWQKTHWRDVTEKQLKRINFTNIRWQQDKINLLGKRIALPRLTSWYGDQGKRYTYSGITALPNSWNKGLLYIKAEVETIAKVSFNTVLLNWYRDGHDYMGWHADNEKELGPRPIISSVNFGDSRDFVIRRIDDPSKKITIPLKHGSLLIMAGEFQNYWQHSVPKRAKTESSRINLTFRTIF